VGSTAHLLPFQASANVRVVLALLRYSPTAVHAVADVQDTPSREPSGFAKVSMAHVVPFQASANGPSPLPTAVHAVAEVHDTADR
jgi:hypothetical protein